LWILSPTTFLLSSTALEYLEDGNLVRSLRVSLLYTGFAAVLIVVLYAVAALASPRHRIARHPQRPLSATVRAASHIPTYQVWKRQRA
jgi:ABC-type Fe3+ transport system permease subunit